jgi:hypothetical protein
MRIFVILSILLSGCVSDINAKFWIKPSLKTNSFDNETIRTGTDSRLMMVGLLLEPEETDDFIEGIKKKLGISAGVVLDFRY